MALDQTTLEADLLEAIKSALFSDLDDPEVEQVSQNFAQQLSQAIFDFVNSAEIVASSSGGYELK